MFEDILANSGTHSHVLCKVMVLKNSNVATCKQTLRVISKNHYLILHTGVDSVTIFLDLLFRHASVSSTYPCPPVSK